MTSQARNSRAEERRLSIRTLAIASAASAASAIVTSRLWTAGTPIAAATTPVIVTIVSEMLHKPTARIAERFTVETDALPEATGSGAPPPAAEQEDDAEPAREQPLRDMPRDVKLYRAAGATGRRMMSWKLIAATAALAFVIGLAALTLPQLIAGQSLLKGNPPGFATATKKKDKTEPTDENGGQSPGQDPQQPPSTSPESTLTTETPSPGTTPEVTPAPEQTTPETTPDTTTAPPPTSTQP